MSVLTFTGPSSLSTVQEVAVVKRMEDLAVEADIWRSGCAFGVDTIAAYQGVMSGVRRIELFVPGAAHNDKLVSKLPAETWNAQIHVVNCPSQVDEPYRRRNEMMLVGANRLIAFVKDLSFYRSGEWMTVNIARKMNIEVDLNLI